MAIYGKLTDLLSPLMRLGRTTGTLSRSSLPDGSVRPPTTTHDAEVIAASMHPTAYHPPRTRNSYPMKIPTICYPGGTEQQPQTYYTADDNRKTTHPAIALIVKLTLRPNDPRPRVEMRIERMR